jgi:hypothetical protein
MDRTRQSTRGLVALVLFVAALGIMLANGDTVSAAPRPIIGGYADWGVKEAFRDYIEGPIAQGTITLSGGATQNADGTFRFPGAATGTYDAATETGTGHFSGSVQFEGHDGVLDMTITDIRIEFAGDDGILRADVASRDLDTGNMISYPDIAFADLDLSSVNPVPGGDSSVSWSSIPAVLTAAGAPSFEGFYQAGEPLDPVSVVLLFDDNCPSVSNPGQENYDGDAQGDACDTEDDGDGFSDAAEAHVGTLALDHCGNSSGPPFNYSTAWPADLNSTSISVNDADTLDLASYIAPTRRINTSSGDPGYHIRWDVSPGSGGLSKEINLLDLSFISTFKPLMFGGSIRAFNGPPCVP